MRVPGADEMYFTAGPSLRDHPLAAVVRVGLDGELREGDLPPIQGAVVAMHTAMYADRPDVGCVLHTHSPYATAYAVAQRPIGCWIEALAMFGLPDGVPVAGYGPRGSDQAVANIRGRGLPDVPAVLLANHGVLVFHRTPDLAVLVGGVVEEAAQAGSAPRRSAARWSSAGAAGRRAAAGDGLRQPGHRARLNHRRFDRLLPHGPGVPDHATAGHARCRRAGRLRCAGPAPARPRLDGAFRAGGAGQVPGRGPPLRR